MPNKKAMQDFISGLIILGFRHHYLEWNCLNVFFVLNQLNYIMQLEGTLFVFPEKLKIIRFSIILVRQ